MIVKVKITPDTLDSKTPEEIDDMIFVKGSQKYLGTFGEYFENTEKDKLLCEIFATTVLESEVCNGGFDQFFYNSEELTEHALNGLIKIGAKEHYELLKQAENMYNEQKLIFVDERNSNLDFLDEQFYKLEEYNLKRQTFITENLVQFYE